MDSKPMTAKNLVTGGLQIHDLKAQQYVHKSLVRTSSHHQLALQAPSTAARDGGAEM
jgi:hypothetical protein